MILTNVICLRLKEHKRLIVCSQFHDTQASTSELRVSAPRLDEEHGRRSADNINYSTWVWNSMARATILSFSILTGRLAKYL